METHPVQMAHLLPREQARITTAVTMAAYEVYCYVFAPQPALVTGECRGGFGIGELVAFLYARSFPQNEWRQRVDEALEGIQGFR